MGDGEVVMAEGMVVEVEVVVEIGGEAIEGGGRWEVEGGVITGVSTYQENEH